MRRKKIGATIIRYQANGTRVHLLRKRMNVFTAISATIKDTTNPMIKFVASWALNKVPIFINS